MPAPPARLARTRRFTLSVLVCLPCPPQKPPLLSAAAFCSRLWSLLLTPPCCDTYIHSAVSTPRIMARRTQWLTLVSTGRAVWQHAPRSPPPIPLALIVELRELVTPQPAQRAHRPACANGRAAVRPWHRERREGGRHLYIRTAGSRGMPASKEDGWYIDRRGFSSDSVQQNWRTVRKNGRERKTRRTAELCGPGKEEQGWRGGAPPPEKDAGQGGAAMGRSLSVSRKQRCGAGHRETKTGGSRGSGWAASVGAGGRWVQRLLCKRAAQGGGEGGPR